MEWFDIETVPESNKSNYFSCIVAWGPDGDKCTGYATRYKDKWFAGALFYRGGRFDQRQYEYREAAIEPTHWAHSPEPPK